MTDDNNENSTSDNIKSPAQWLRGLCMLVVAVVLHITSFVMGVLIVLQFLFALITGSDNQELRKFGGTASKFVHAALNYLSYNTEEKPFPFAPWPKNDE